MADSTLKCNTHGFIGCLPTQAFPGPGVEFALDTRELLLGYDSEIGLLGEVFSNEAVRVLVRTAFPCMICVSEETSHASLRFQRFEMSVLRSAIQGEGAFQRRRKAIKPAGDREKGCSACLARELRDEDEARLPLDEGVHPRLVRNRLNGIAFPVANTNACHDLSGAGIDHKSGRDDELFSPPHPFGSAALLLSAEVRAEVETARFHESGAGRNLGIHVLIYGFRGNAFSKINSDASRDLLGRPAFPEVGDHVCADGGILEAFRTAAGMAVGERPRMGETRGVPVPLVRQVPPDFAGDRPRRPPQSPSNAPDRLLLPQTELDLLPLLNGKVLVLHTLDYARVLHLLIEPSPYKGF